MVHTTIAQQYQIDDGEYNLQDPDIEEVRWRDSLASLELHVVVDGGYFVAVTQDQRSGCLLLDRLRKSIPLVPLDAKSVWVGRGVLVKTGCCSRMVAS